MNMLSVLDYAVNVLKAVMLFVDIMVAVALKQLWGINP
jgi:hypothetical protein